MSWLIGELSKLFKRSNKDRFDSNKTIRDKTIDSIIARHSQPKVMIEATITTSYVGNLTGSTASDFYVYVWFIKDTEEIFYVGKGRGNRHSQFHENSYEAEKIRELYDTSFRLAGENLTELQALELESKEMSRILDETNDRLTNRIIPLSSKRKNGYDRCFNTPKLEFEKAPHLFVNEIEQHYYNLTSQRFDEVKTEKLRTVFFFTTNIGKEVEVIYGGNTDKYINETKNMLLKSDGNKIIKSQYAKSVTAWIFIGDTSVTNINLYQEKALEKIGKNIPVYHLIDVWKLLKESDNF